MTIREHLIRKQRIIVIALFTALFAGLATMGARHGGVLPWAAVCLAIAFAVAIHALLFAFKCPRCGANWGEIMGRAQGWKLPRDFTACPNCRVSLDAQVNETRNI